MAAGRPREHLPAGIATDHTGLRLVERQIDSRADSQLKHITTE